MFEFVSAILLVLALLCATLRAANVAAKWDLGWLAIALTLAALWVTPSLIIAVRINHFNP